ncbi:MAG TPA: class I tRNA ligase family protein [Anaerolineales bacterium]|nr:class I tRNA ligase family protein [Anaerolineales bacterium]
MTFKPVPNKIDLVAQEYDVLDFWEMSDAFEKMREVHKGKPKWSFLDGPITANNPMGVHHGWGRTYKDLYNRFWTMQGRELRYQQGFDCQGLWVEVEVERELGFKSKKDIEAYGLEKFIRKCKERVLKYAAVQTEQSIRLGYWMDWNDPDELRLLADLIASDPTQEFTLARPDGPVTDTIEQLVGRLGLQDLGGSYFTFSNENNYMIWAFLKQCWENGWVYRGADSMPWCPRCATAISQHEIVTDGYAELTHPSITLRFPLRSEDRRPGTEDGGPGTEARARWMDDGGRVKMDGGPGREVSGPPSPVSGLRESLLVWTTTPWTLTSNVAAAVGPELVYARVRQGDEVFYLSKGTLHMLDGEFVVLGELKGAEMEGWTYDGPFDELEAANTPGGVTPLRELVKGVSATAREAHTIILWDEVSDEEGTGIVHIAPGCGKEDFELGKEYHLPMIAPLNEEGFFLPEFGFLAGFDAKDPGHREKIFDNLREKGLVYKVEDYTHRYPTCWRCKTELVFRLVDEWFISMGPTYDKPREELTSEEKAASLRYQMMDVVDGIRWIPDFGHAREMDWLRNMHDWLISKKRYWGLALPIWVCEDCKAFEVVGSDDELEERAVEGWETFEGHTPHRPFIDAVKIACSTCEGRMARIADVGNPWLDAGIVSFSTMHYREDPEYWKAWFPADWVSESFPGQFRNWFYSLLAMSTVLEGRAPFKTLFGYATLFAEDGREMHKSWGNSIEFNEAANEMGVDVMRWLFCAHKPENNLLFGYNRADEVRRRFLIPLWNIYSFFVTYANLDRWHPPGADPTHAGRQTEDFDPAHPEGATPESANALDRWILSRLNRVVERTTRNLEDYDAFAATLVIEPLIEDLSNWYVRRSRRRFWKSGLDEDKHVAYLTLYHALVKLARMLAPFTPFVAEVMYQNLVTGMYPAAHMSVHHTSWPEPDPAALDGELDEQMALARQVASMGLSARGAANLKVRQPLSKVMVHAGEGRAELSGELIEIVADELNVKAFEFVDDPGRLVGYRVLPNNQLLGPKFGADFPKLRAALAGLDPRAVAATVGRGEPVEFDLEDGRPVSLAPEEILVETMPAEGLATATDRYLTVGIDATVTPELKTEGQAREIVRRIQDMRKSAGFNIEDRIRTWYAAGDALTHVVAEWGSYIKTETLSLDLIAGEGPEDGHTETHDLDVESIRLTVKQAG